MKSFLALLLVIISSLSTLGGQLATDADALKRIATLEAADQKAAVRELPRKLSASTVSNMVATLKRSRDTNNMAVEITCFGNDNRSLTLASQIAYIYRSAHFSHVTQTTNSEAAFNIPKGVAVVIQHPNDPRDEAVKSALTLMLKDLSETNQVLVLSNAIRLEKPFARGPDIGSLLWFKLQITVGAPTK